MTRTAIGRRTGVFPSHMTLRTLRLCVRPAQGENCLGVIECRRVPRRRRMTNHAIVIEAGCNMVRIRHFRIIGLVTRPAIGWQTLVLSVLMTENTICSDVRAGQRENRLRMIEGRRLPNDSSMACQAIMRELTGDVIRCNDFYKIRLVTAVAIGR